MALAKLGESQYGLGMLIGIKVHGWFSLAVWLPIPLGAASPTPPSVTTEPVEPVKGPGLASTRPSLRVVRQEVA